MLKKIKKPMLFLGILAGGYLAVCSLMYFFQESFMFFPEKLPQDHVFAFRGPLNWEEVWIENQGTKINGLLFRANSSKGVVLYFHGNAGSLQGWGYIAQDFLPLGWDVLIIDYRSYGKSEGNHSYQAFLDDAEKAYEYLLPYYHEENIFVYGRSIGSGIAAHVAAINQPAALILETPYTSMIDLSRQHYGWLPVGWLHRYPFSVVEQLPHISCPVSIIHGTNDKVIPVSHSRALFEEYPRQITRYEEIKGGDHNNLAQYPQFQRFLMDALPTEGNR
jgi:pimeloyl-ACP methyl ester carboxylesterase